VTLHKPLYMQAAGGDPTIAYPAVEDRLLITSMWETEGVIAGGLKVSQRAAGANFSVDVAAGQAVISGDDVANQGTYQVFSDAVENLTIPAPPGSGTRIHRVVAQVRDKLHSGSYSTYDWLLQVLEDTGSGTPAVPGSAYSLALVSVSAGQASVLDSHITGTRFNALMRPNRGRLVSSDAGRPDVPLDFERLARTDKGCEELYISGTWYEVPRIGGGGSAWSTYTPQLTASTTNPTLGTGSVVNGSYVRYGRTVHLNVNIKFGTSGVNAGSGFYHISLPVVAKTLSAGNHMGSAQGHDNSASNAVDGVCRIGSGGYDKAQLLLQDNLVSNSAPWTWAAQDQIHLSITYEAAS
jgi:hypothetical protein